ncbi:hypothetical protein C5167_043673 [Papaver somniferum]|uniref:Peptidase A1 domain-containing protein n=1 Tax=Papaver somniferum TaxID=3469 RepID=A0A4Y7L6D8_PAPSO|nr:aspartic proteinase CDR1-like [Papaver somniferum]RZC81103.1 hypothetical protein C5167_043673 [Papaver somniferum]
MTTPSRFSLVFILLSVLVHADANGGFSVHLIHRDFSPNSPYYNSLETHHDRVQTAIRRSISRTNGAVKKSSSSVASFPSNANQNGNITTTLNAIGGDYLMNISIGTPPRQLLVSTDTGSSITWVQCKPCQDCYEQNEPLFDPKESSSYKNIHCMTPVCFKLGKSMACENKLCKYDIGYGDKSSSTGHLAFETLTFDSTSGRPVKIPQFAVGCGHSNEGFKDVYSNGMVGLGTGKLSLISQLGAKIDSKFSYCLVDADIGSSKFNFGSPADITGKDVVSTPFITVEEGLYYLTLQAVSVNDKRIPFKSKEETDGQEGNIAIDSGTTLTLLPEEMYSDIVSEVKKATNSEGFISSETGLLCFKSDKNTKFPSITFHFMGADIKLQDGNSFLSTPDGVCLTCHSAGDGYVLYGNLAQMDFLVEYDLKDKKVSFKPTDCSKNN